MKRRLLVLIAVAAAAFVACTNDYDQFRLAEPGSNRGAVTDAHVTDAGVRDAARGAK